MQLGQLLCVYFSTEARSMSFFYFPTLYTIVCIRSNNNNKGQLVNMSFVTSLINKELKDNFRHQIDFDMIDKVTAIPLKMLEK